MIEIDKQRTEVVQKNKAALLEFMAANKVTKALASFDGSGDSGQIEYVELYSGNELLDNSLLNTPADVITSRQRWTQDTGWVLETTVERQTISDLVEETVWHPLESHFGGWEINEGAYGEVVVHSDGTGEIICNQRVIDINTESASF